MKHSAERIEFIHDYIHSYEKKIKELNKQGLFNDAKMFELFASNVGQLYLGLTKPLTNLNIDNATFPCVDLFSEDGNVFCQVSTCQNVPAKIRATLKKIKDSKLEKIKSIKEVYFFVLSNKSINKVKDLTIGNVTFVKSKNLITTSNIIEKAIDDLVFQEKLYFLLKKEDEMFKSNFKKYQEAIDYDSKVILNDIDEFINKTYHIDISTQIDEINSNKDKFVLISGEAGSGKSVLCKKLLETKKNVLCARAEKLVEKGDVNEIWGFNIKDTLSLVMDKVYIYVDALEYIADNRNKLDVLDSLLERLRELDNTYLICSCRSSDLGAFIKTISKYNVVEYKIKPIDKATLTDISKKLPTLKKIIKNSKYDSLLVNPFYINFLTKLNDFNSIQDEDQLRKKIWKEIICLNDSAIETIITNIVLERATRFILYSDAARYDKNLIDKLLSMDVLIENENGIRLKYDIFEDICFEQYIDNLFNKSKSDYSLFFKEMEKLGRCIYRRYQIWIENKLFSKTNRQKFLYTLISTETIPSHWKQQSIIGIIKSIYCQDFFEEYSLEIVNNGLLSTFIHITNIYGFEIDKISFNLGTFVLKNKGFGRESLIKIIYEREIYKNDFNNAKSIKKLIFDYTNLLTNKEISTYAFQIIKYYVEKTLENNRSYDSIKKEVEAIYKLHGVADCWIKEFFIKIKSLVKEENDRKNDFANEAIKDIISSNVICLFKDYSEYVMEFYDIYYTTLKENDNPFYNDCYEGLNRNTLFGLNENAEEYEHKSFYKDPKCFNSIYVMLRVSFWATFKWYLKFINKCVDAYKLKEDVYSYNVYFSKDHIKEYFGTSEMWVTGEYQNNMPALLSDMTFIVKSVIIDFIRNLDEKSRTEFANNVKRMIYEETNNIIGLSIISNIGLTFSKELPGYCLELVSSLEIILADLSRYRITANNPTRKMLENEIAKKVGLPGLSENKYKSVNPNAELRKYTIESQLKYPQLQSKYFEMFDYLYSVVKNDEQQASLYLQLQQMDLRNALFNKIDSSTIGITFKVNGAAKEISDAADERINSQFKIYEKIKNILDSFENPESVTVEEIDEFVKVVLEYESNPLAFQFSNILITYVSFALSKLSIDFKKRNEYCLLWIKYAKKQLNNETIIIDANFYQFLFNQLEEEINDIVKNEIKSIILNLLINRNDNDGTIYQIFNVARRFLISNKKYGTLYLNTIFLLAEDEMNHQIYNYEYSSKYHKDKKEDFVPNMQPRLNRVDYYIEQEKQKVFKSKKEEIIKKYLFEEQDYDYSNMDIRNLDVRIISHAFSCGLDLKKLSDKTFISSYLSQLIEIYHKKADSYHKIIGYYEVYEVEEYFKQALLDENLYSLVFNILFDNVDFKKFTSETVNFYLNIFASLTAYYFDAYDSKEKRRHIENVIRLMEKYINNIPIEYIKYELSKALFLGFSRYGGIGDWSNLKTIYTYSDKVFLNDIFSKYGNLHFYDLLVVIDHLQYKKLLPEILIGIYNSFNKYNESENKSVNKLEQIIDFINQIMYHAFVHCEEDIKGDTELINAFEGILLLLIKLKDEKAAVLLDEFRIH